MGQENQVSPGIELPVQMKLVLTRRSKLLALVMIFGYTASVTVLPFQISLSFMLILWMPPVAFGIVVLMRKILRFSTSRLRIAGDKLFVQIGSEWQEIQAPYHITWNSRTRFTLRSRRVTLELNFSRPKDALNARQNIAEVISALSRSTWTEGVNELMFDRF